MPELVWSLADTHCVWCGKPRCEHSSSTGQCTEVWDGAELVGELRALVEAQAAVIQRYLEGWGHTWGVEGRGEWINRLRRTREPMLPAEQVAVYGEVVRTEKADTDG